MHIGSCAFVAVVAGCYIVPAQQPPPYGQAVATTPPATPPPPREIPLGSATSCTIPPEQPPMVGGGTAQEVAERAGLHELDWLFGRYLRGDVVVYVGTLRASDGTSAVAPGPALAELFVGPSSASDWYPAQPAAVGSRAATLVVHATGTGAHMIFEQTDAAPNTTWVTGVGHDMATSAFRRSCEGCLPDLAQRPPHLPGDLVVQGPGDVRAAFDLTAVSPCRLTLEHFAVLDTGDGANTTGTRLGDFKLVGDRYVAQRTASIEGGNEAHKCSTTHPFTYEISIDAHDLGRFGVGNVKIGAPQSVCAP